MRTEKNGTNGIHHASSNGHALPPIEVRSAIPEPIPEVITLTLAAPAAPKTLAVIAGYTPMDPRARRKLVKLSSEQAEAATGALDELGEAGAQVAKDMGPHAPDPSRAAKLALDLKEAQANLDAAESTAAFWRDRAVSVMQEVADLLGEAKVEYQHALLHDPELGRRYARLGSYLAARSAPTVEGRARARKARRKAEKNGQK